MTSEPKFHDMTQLYVQSVRAHASRPLFGTKVGDTWRWTTYGDFGADVDAARGGLASLGIGPGDRVAVIANNRVEWAVGAYATYGLRASYVPMYEAQLPREWQFILADCGAKVLLVADDAIRQQIEPLRASLPALTHVVVMSGRGVPERALSWSELLARGRASRVAPQSPADPSEIAGFIYTSGTTGNPKGVLLSHGNLASNVSAIHAVFPITEDDRSLSFLPWAHSFGQVVELHGLFSMGASMGLAESVERLVENLVEVKPTLLVGVPRVFNRIRERLNARVAASNTVQRRVFGAALANEDDRRTLASQGKRSGVSDLKHALYDKLVFERVRARFGGRLKYAFSGGAALGKEVAEFVDSLGITVYEGYGLTETSPIATANWPGARKIGSVGKPIPGVRIVIDHSATGDDKIGEVVVHGPNVMQGYHGLPEENARVFTPDGGLRTGDLGFLDDAGFLYITGRLKEQYKLETGKYVSPAPLEEQLRLSPYIANAMVHGENQPFNVALIVANGPALEVWAKEQRLGARGDALLEEPAVRRLFEEEIARQSGEFKQFEKIRRFALIREDFTTENDMLTPSLKLKRRVVLKRFGQRIMALYDA